MSSSNPPAIIGPVPFRFKIAVIWQQIKNFSRYLRFYWKSLAPAPVTTQGFKLYGNRHMVSGHFEPEETRLVERMLLKADVFINVGANVGYYCCLALARGKQAIAFEPIDLNVRHILANVRVNGWQDRLEVFPVALGEKPGILEIYGGGTGASLLRGWANNPDHHVSLAPVTTLDRVLGHRLAGQRCLVLIDIEGAEYFMLQGARDMLTLSPKPMWMVEICITGHRADGETINPRMEDTFKLFRDAGYEAWTAEAAPRKVPPEEISAIAQSGRNTLPCHNFIFVEPGIAPALLGL